MKLVWTVCAVVIGLALCLLMPLQGLRRQPASATPNSLSATVTTTGSAPQRQLLIWNSVSIDFPPSGTVVQAGNDSNLVVTVSFCSGRGWGYYREFAIDVLIDATVVETFNTTASGGSYTFVVDTVAAQDKSRNSSDSVLYARGYYVATGNGPFATLLQGVRRRMAVRSNRVNIIIPA
jgi:hypothetical protein